MTNAINVIQPYKHFGMWVFDDDRVGLDKEPFVAGADSLIDLAIEQFDIHDADNGFVMIFSKHKFPTAQVHLKHDRKEAGGDVYRWDEADMEGWLCPALLRYFDEAPEDLYVQIKDR